MFLIQAYLPSFAFHFIASQMLWFLQSEGKTLRRQKDYVLLYGSTRFIAVAGTKAAIALRYACILWTLKDILNISKQYLKQFLKILW